MLKLVLKALLTTPLTWMFKSSWGRALTLIVISWVLVHFGVVNGLFAAGFTIWAIKARVSK